MLKRFSYVILSDKSLILEYYSGDCNINAFIESKEKVSNDNDYNPNFDIIHDFRDAEFLFEVKEISKYIKRISADSKMFGNRKSVMLTRTPNQVVACMHFELDKGDLPISVKICSTLECACNFIKLTINEQKFAKSMLNELKISILQSDRSIQ